MSEAAAPPAAPSAPLGKPRKVIVIILLSIITLGIYGLIWVFKTFEEMKQFSGRGVGGWVGLLLDIFLGFVIPFLMASEVGAIYRQDKQEPPVSGWTGLWVFLPLIGGIIWLCKTQWALNRFWEDKEATI
jgi:hypothetical protein